MDQAADGVNPGRKTDTGIDSVGDMGLDVEETRQALDDIRENLEEMGPELDKIQAEIDDIFATIDDLQGISDSDNNNGQQGNGHSGGGPKTLSEIQAEIDDIFATIDDLQGNSDIDSGDVAQVKNDTQEAALSLDEIQAEIDDINADLDALLGDNGGKSSDAKEGAENVRPVDPLIFDLDGDGVKIIGIEDSTLRFDSDGDGFKEATDWFSAGDGILVYDLNGDNNIESIHEVVSPGLNADLVTGTDTNSLQVLAQFDVNSDGVIDANDWIYEELAIWQDQNQNAKSDAGELISLLDAGITAISLSAQGDIATDPTSAVIGTTHASTAAGDMAVAIVNFMTNTNGVSWSVDGDTHISQTENGDTIVSVRNFEGGTINLSDHDAQIGHGSFGNDTLIGSSGDDLLIGYQGDDIFQAGDGDDWIVASAEDSLDKIDGGDGFDLVQFVGDEGVKFNLGLSNVEYAHGASGNDFFIASSVYNAVIVGGAGDDIILGGFSDDILNGEEGFDIIYGGDGDDLIRGHRGDDALFGGEGHDLIYGGLDDDVLKGESGNDTLVGGSGYNLLDGGEGTDTASFIGKVSDYRIEHTDDGLIVTDLIADRDGTNLLHSIEHLSFSDLNRVETDADVPIALNDHLDLSGDLQDNGTFIIQASTLLANDVDFQADDLRIKNVSNAVGGTVELMASGDIRFTVDPGFVGLHSFHYEIADEHGHTDLKIRYRRPDGDIIVDHQAMVTLGITDLPDDPMVKEQWYLHNTNIPAVWEDYTGAGVDVGVFEVAESFQGTLPEYSRGSGLMDHAYSDLDPNSDNDFQEQNEQPEDYSRHATHVAGIIGAAKDGQGIVGAAYDSNLYSIEIPHIGEKSLITFQDYDVVNNSWATKAVFGDNYEFLHDESSGIEDAVRKGRDGLGTVIVNAAGNDRAEGSRAALRSMNSSRHGINVAAINHQGDLGSLKLGTNWFSEPGSSLLVSAPGSDILSTSVYLENDQGEVFNNGYTRGQGTSYAAPVVSGVAALMLEANASLGYRDVQEILAYSAQRIDDPNSSWSYNGALNWNGGGLHSSDDYGFGNVDALAAVRLAETWTELDTRHNEVSLAAFSGVLNQSIPDQGRLTSSVTLADDIEIEHVEVTIDFAHEQLGDLQVVLTGPDGTKSVLLDRAGVGEKSVSPRGEGAQDTRFTFNSTKTSA